MQYAECLQCQVYFFLLWLFAGLCCSRFKNVLCMVVISTNDACGAIRGFFFYDVQPCGLNNLSTVITRFTFCRMHSREPAATSGARSPSSAGCTLYKSETSLRTACHEVNCVWCDVHHRLIVTLSRANQTRLSLKAFRGWNWWWILVCCNHDFLARPRWRILATITCIRLVVKFWVPAVAYTTYDQCCYSWDGALTVCSWVVTYRPLLPILGWVTALLLFGGWWLHTQWYSTTTEELAFKVASFITFRDISIVAMAVVSMSLRRTDD